MSEVSPSWAKPGAADEFGNVACAVCGKVQSPRFDACVSCCKHERLAFTEGWHGADDGGGWEIEAYCAVCGKNYDFSNETLIRDYQAVKKAWRRG